MPLSSMVWVRWLAENQFGYCPRLIWKIFLNEGSEVSQKIYIVAKESLPMDDNSQQTIYQVRGTDRDVAVRAGRRRTRE